METAHDERKIVRKRSFPIEKIPFLPRLFAGLFRLHHWSCRTTVLGQEHEDAALACGRPVMFTAWHFSFPAVIYHMRDRDGMVMVSRSRDGDLLSKILYHLGYASARGSSNRGGSTAFRQILTHYRSGRPVGFIADGSQGPARIAQKGILIMARHTQAPLVPVSMAAKPCWRFRSWDRTVLAKPFSRIVMAFGPPILVDRKVSDEELEDYRVNLQKTLNRLTLQAEEALR